MRKFILLVFLNLSFFSTLVYSQNFGWVQLPDSPVPDSTSEARIEDTHFLNANTGYVISYRGKVFKTLDGGANWITLFDSLSNRLRSVGFFSPSTGIIGTLDSSNVLFRTSNGGVNWTMIASSVQGVLPKGICGISIIDSNTAFATGRYTSPANLIKTTDRGLNWISIPLDTSLIRMVVDCHFWSADSGIIVGGWSPNNIYNFSRAIVLLTSDGGKTFVRTFISALSSEWCWKVQFISRITGYVSIQRFSSAPYLKTTDGGLSWTLYQIPGQINLQSIGFINEETGWAGGWGSNGYMPTVETTNGGVNWHPAGWGFNVNRFRFINDTLAYAVGNRVFKYMRVSVGIQQISSEVPDSYSLSQNYPNPFNPATKINFDLPFDSKVTMKIFDITGREIATLVNEVHETGYYTVTFDAGSIASGVYFYKIIAEGGSQQYVMTKKMVLVR